MEFENIFQRPQELATVTQANSDVTGALLRGQR